MGMTGGMKIFKKTLFISCLLLIALILNACMPYYVDDSKVSAAVENAVNQMKNNEELNSNDNEINITWDKYDPFAPPEGQFESEEEYNEIIISKHILPVFNFCMQHFQGQYQLKNIGIEEGNVIIDLNADEISSVDYLGYSSNYNFLYICQSLQANKLAIFPSYGVEMNIYADVIDIYKNVRNEFLLSIEFDEDTINKVNWPEVQPLSDWANVESMSDSYWINENLVSEFN
jgi:hypothetical protein